MSYPVVTRRWARVDDVAMSARCFECRRPNVEYTIFHWKNRSHVCILCTECVSILPNSLPIIEVYHNNGYSVIYHPDAGLYQHMDGQALKLNQFHLTKI